jgi:hypothetical protein
MRLVLIGTWTRDVNPTDGNWDHRELLLSVRVIIPGTGDHVIMILLICPDWLTGLEMRFARGHIQPHFDSRYLLKRVIPVEDIRRDWIRTV